MSASRATANGLNIFRQRFCCRRFKPDRLTEEQIASLLEAARWAPSAGNMQPWRFVLVGAPEIKLGLAQAAFGQEHLTQAPIVIAVCAVPEESERRYGRRGRDLYCLQDTAAATQNLLLAAATMGLGACWVGAFDEALAAKALRVPATWRVVALVPVGRPAATAPPRDRHPLEHVVLTRR
jgi:nitroreductase